MSHKEPYSSEMEAQLFQATVQFERTALLFTGLLNGGAVIAMLGLLGKILTVAEPRVAVDEIRVAMLMWIIGITLTAIASFCGYFSQAFFYRQYRKIGTLNVPRGINAPRVMMAAAYLWASLSLAFFLWGALKALDGLLL